MNFVLATHENIKSWMKLLNLVEDNFPGLDKPEYEENLKKSISNGEALISIDGDTVTGALLFSKHELELTFLAVHPDYRKQGIAKKLISKMISLLPSGTQLYVITYREGDSLGLAARKLYESVGFVYGELITVFDYPCQKMIYKVK